MKCARQSRYWKSYRDSKTFTLTIYIYEAHLGFSSGSGNLVGGSALSSGSFHNLHGSSFHNLHGNSFHNLHGGSFHSHHGASVDTSGGGGGGGTAGGGGPWDTKIVVSLPKDPMGERHETSRAGKTPNPVWDQAVVFRDIDYSELVRVEMRGIRKLGDNPVLASVEFEVHDVMGLSLRDGASVFQLECDRSRARYGVILLAFRFDPPVAADVLGEFDGIGSAMVPRGVSAAAVDQIEEEDAITPAWGRTEQGHQPEAEPVYINVEGHFACLLLDEDIPSYPCKLQPARPSSSTSSSVSFGPPVSSAAATRDKDASPGRSKRGSYPGGAVALQQHPRLSFGSTKSAKSENSIFDPESLIHGRGSAVRMAAMAEQLSAREGGGGDSTGGGGGGGAGGKRRSAAKESRARPRSLGSSLAHQLSALGLGGVGGGAGGRGGGGKASSSSSSSGGSSSAANKRGKQPTSVEELRRRSSGANSSDDAAARLETPQQRWLMPRRRLKHHEHTASGSADANANANAAAGTEAEGSSGRSYRGSGKRVRSRGGGFSRAPGFPILSSLRARASGGAARARSKSTSAAPPYPAATPYPADSADSADCSCASTVRAGEEALVLEPAPSAEPSGVARHPALVASAECDVPVSLELSPTGFRAPLVQRSFSVELASARE